MKLYFKDGCSWLLSPSISAGAAPILYPRRVFLRLKEADTHLSFVCWLSFTVPSSFHLQNPAEIGSLFRCCCTPTCQSNRFRVHGVSREIYSQGLFTSIWPGKRAEIRRSTNNRTRENKINKVKNQLPDRINHKEPYSSNKIDNRRFTDKQTLLLFPKKKKLLYEQPSKSVGLPRF